MMIMASLACNMAVVFRQQFPNAKAEIPPFENSKNPVWNNLTHMSNDQKVLQVLITSLSQFMGQINQIVLLGSNSEQVSVTGDEIVDGDTATRTMSAGSQTEVIQYNSTDCFENKKGSCDKENRVYSLYGQFKGLEALLGMLNAATTVISNMAISQQSDVSLKLPEVQIILSLMIYDLRGGCTKYRAAILAEQQEEKNMYSTLLILFFIFGLIAQFIGFVFCLIPT
ncbi:MAG: hypothetical protein EZS28_047534, partial [Streblomastix strix]